MVEFDWSGHIRSLQMLPTFAGVWEKDLLLVLERFEGLLKGNLLEVGCSNGRWLRFFQNRFGCLGFGIDLNCIGFRSDLMLTKADAFKLPFPDSCFDVIFSLGFLEHFNRSERKLLIDEQTRMLKVNGLLICQIPNSYLTVEMVKTKVLYDLRKGFHHYLIKPKDFLGLFSSFNILYWNFIGIALEWWKSIKRLESYIGWKRMFSTEILLIAQKQS